MAERVGFGLLLVVENKELTGIHLPHDPLEPLKTLGRRTYDARGAVAEDQATVRVSLTSIQRASIDTCSRSLTIRAPPRR